MIEKMAPRKSCSFDNLRNTMRDTYYELAQASTRITHLTAGRIALSGYDNLSEQNDPPVTTFKGLPVLFDPALLDNEMRFHNGGAVVAVIRHIS